MCRRNSSSDQFSPAELPKAVGTPGGQFLSIRALISYLSNCLPPTEDHVAKPSCPIDAHRLSPIPINDRAHRSGKFGQRIVVAKSPCSERERGEPLCRFFRHRAIPAASSLAALNRRMRACNVFAARCANDVLPAQVASDRECTDHVVAFGEGHLHRIPAMPRALLQCVENSSFSEQRPTCSSADREPRCHHCRI